MSTIHFATDTSVLGSVLVAWTARGVSAILLGDTPDELERELRLRLPYATRARGAAFVDAVVAFLAAPDRGLDIPLDVQGTAFRRRVWQAVRDVPAGTTATYTEIAGRIASPRAARAVARACAANVLAVAIPCHRVVGRGGALAGYRWGVVRKRALLDREARA